MFGGRGSVGLKGGRREGVRKGEGNTMNEHGKIQAEIHIVRSLTYMHTEIVRT